MGDQGFMVDEKAEEEVVDSVVVGEGLSFLHYPEKVAVFLLLK